MATVYRAYQADLDRLVAIKLVRTPLARDPIFIQRFEREVRVLAQLEHRAIVPVYDAGEHDGQAYLAMRYLRAGTVGDLLSWGPLALPDVARLLLDVAGALDYAHGQGIVHRDVKPSNILVDKAGHAYLTDFGLAKVVEASMNMTRSGEAVGTPTYMAPEQTLGRQVTAQTDVYALGVMLFELVTGRPPFVAEAPLALALMHVRAATPSPRELQPNLPEAVEAVILKALAKNPAERYPTAGALARAFGEAVSVSVTTAALPPAIATRELDAQSTVKLLVRASQVTADKSLDIVTDDVRREVQRIESAERWQKTRRWLPWAVAALVIMALVASLAATFGELGQRRTAADQTATAIADLLGQLGDAQTAVAGGADLGPTVSALQTQIAAGLVATGTPGMTTVLPMPTVAPVTFTSLPTSAPASTATRTVPPPTPSRAPVTATVTAPTLAARTSTPGSQPGTQTRLATDTPRPSATANSPTDVPTNASPSPITPTSLPSTVTPAASTATTAPSATPTSPQPTASSTSSPPTATPMPPTPTNTPLLGLPLPTLPIPLPTLPGLLP
jgi:serine/threonine-protein kinase